MQVDLMDRT